MTEQTEAAPVGADPVRGVGTPDHAGRRERLRARLAARELPAAVVTARPNVAYLTGFRGSWGQVLITPDGAVLITDGRYRERAAAEAPDVEVAEARDWVGEALDRLGAAGLDRVGFEADALSYRDGRSLVRQAGEAGIEATATTDLVEQLRVVKDPAEVALLAEACRITVQAWEQIAAEVAAGWTERDLAVRLERTFVDRGAEQPAFDTIAAAGPNGAVPHHAPSDRPLGPGELVTVDAGARVGGYHADMTRTVAIGEPPAALAEVHEVVRAAQAAGRGAARAGVSCEAVDAAAREVIDEAGHGDAFIHGVGHGVGLQIHEAPILSSADASLEAGTVITVEPGIYLPGTGGVRIEDTVVVADGPPRVLTETPRELRSL